jgi:hypothetical protein
LWNHRFYPWWRALKTAATSSTQSFTPHHAPANRELHYPAQVERKQKEQQFYPTESADGLCWQCGMKGKHHSPAECIAQLRDCIADLEMKNLPPLRTYRRRHTIESETFAPAPDGH